MPEFHPPEVDTLALDDVVERIVTLTTGLRDFWRSADGWAPVDAAELLSRSRLDWQVHLATCLRDWQPGDRDLNDGHLILAWANLGALVEGTLKLFLSVYYKDYAKDLEAIRKKGKLVAPDGVTLEPLRQFFARRIWQPNDKWDGWISGVQNRRNAIHAFRDRPVGSFDDFYADVRQYLLFLRRINGQLPYPDEGYGPLERY